MPPALDRERPGEGPLVRGFAGKGFRVDGQVHAGGLLLTPLWARDWNAPALDALAVADVEAVLAIDPAPEFLLLGTGPTMRRPSPTFVAAIEARGAGVDVMDSRAAARAWGVLRAEGRWIVAALLPLG
jgi:uncharacterized protein